MSFGGKFKVGDRVLIKGQRFIWVVTGYKLNIRTGRRVILTRDAGWASISTTIPEAKVAAW